jgi:hypothetical protein
MELIIDSDGTIRCVYGEELELTVFGPTLIRRASHVEPDSSGQWFADLLPVRGPELGPFSQRSEALAAEVAWLKENWLETSLRIS